MKVSNLGNYGFPKEKQWFPTFNAFICSCLFDVFLIIFRHRILYRFFHDFGCHFGSIFHWFSTLWTSFWHTFSVSIFSWFFDAILKQKGTNLNQPDGIPSVTFFIKNHVFFWASIWHRFLMDFDGFLVGFCMDFHEFWTHFRASGFFFRSFWIHFAQLRVVVSSFSATSIV